MKMHKLGIRGTVWSWIADFLSDRTARCYLKGSHGTEFFTFVGLPQGSVISLILFIIFLQDILKDISCSKVKFADDGTIWATGADPTYLANIIEEAIHKLLLCTLKWRMKISLDKTEICLFSRSNLDVEGSSLTVQLNGEDIPYNSNPKILGLHLDESLNFQTHIKKTKQKANK